MEHLKEQLHEGAQKKTFTRKAVEEVWWRLLHPFMNTIFDDFLTDLK